VARRIGHRPGVSQRTENQAVDQAGHAARPGCDRRARRAA